MRSFKTPSRSGINVTDDAELSSRSGLLAPPKRTSVKKPHAHQSVGLFFFLRSRKVLTLKAPHQLRQLGDTGCNAPAKIKRGRQATRPPTYLNR